MEEYTNYQAQQPGFNQIPPQRQPLPNATAVLVLGILSIVLCFCYGIVGLILGIIALYMGNKSISMYNEQPELFDQSSYNNTKAGRVCAIIGVSLSALYLVILIIYIIFVGAMISTFPWQNFKM
jgi:hypothetical protein